MQRSSADAASCHRTCCAYSNPRANAVSGTGIAIEHRAELDSASVSRPFVASTCRGCAGRETRPARGRSAARYSRSADPTRRARRRRWRRCSVPRACPQRGPDSPPFVRSGRHGPRGDRIERLSGDGRNREGRAQAYEANGVAQRRYESRPDIESKRRPLRERPCRGGAHERLRIAESRDQRAVHALRRRKRDRSERLLARRGIGAAGH